MLFHAPDNSFARLKSCWKRAAKFAAPGEIDPSHPLAPAWSNCKLMLDAEGNGKRYASFQEYVADEDERVEAAVFSLSCLDWFALKLDDYSKSHMLSGDASIAAMLHEWKERLILDPAHI